MTSETLVSLYSWIIIFLYIKYTPLKQTCPLKIDGWKMYSLLKMDGFHCHVSLIVTFQKHRQLCEHGVWKSPRKSAAELFDALAGVKDGRVTMVHWRAFVKP